MSRRFIFLFIFIAGLFSQSANIYVFDTRVDIEGTDDGFIQGVQMTLIHGLDFSIELEDFFVSDYITQDSSTVIMIAHDSEIENQLFSYSGEIFISEVIVAMNLPNQGIVEINASVIYKSDCDINNDDSVNVVDVVLLVNMIFDDTEFGSDINQDGMVNVIDIVAMINFIFYESFAADEIIPPNHLIGCMDPDACNYEEQATINAGCWYAIEPCTCEDGGPDDLIDDDNDNGCNNGLLNDISGTWQLEYVAFYEGPNCEFLDGEFFGPYFEINDTDNEVCTSLNDTYDQECSVGEYIYLTEEDCESAGFEWEYDDCWSCFERVENENEIFTRLLHLNQDGSYFHFHDEDEESTEYENSDNDCNGIYDYCSSWSEDVTEKDFESGYYELTSGDLSPQWSQDIQLTLNTNSNFEIRNGVDSYCSGCESDSGCSDESFVTEVDCVIAGYIWIEGQECNENIYNNCIQFDEWINTNGYDQTFIVDELNDSFMRLKHVEIDESDYYNGYYNQSYDMECSYWEYSKVDSYSIGGCTNPSFSNYNPYATFNDGTCNENVCPGYLNNNQYSNKFDLIK